MFIERLVIICSFSIRILQKDRDLVIAIGSKQACEKAKQLIADRVTELEKVVTQKMQIDPKHYPALRSRQVLFLLANISSVSLNVEVICLCWSFFSGISP